MGSAARFCRFDVVAHLLSILGAPPVLALPIAFLAGLRAGGYPRMTTSVVELVVWVSVLPTLVTFALFRAGRTSTLELRDRGDRVVPCAVTAACCVAALVQLQLSDVPVIVSRLTIGVGVQMSLLLLLTLYWKVSYHAAVAASLVVVGRSFDNPSLTIGLLLLALCIGWARVYRRRHTVAQVAAGMLTMAPVALLS
jgi:membrane-associated phospholipid phosphatase